MTAPSWKEPAPIARWAAALVIVGLAPLARTASIHQLLSLRSLGMGVAAAVAVGGLMVAGLRSEGLRRFTASVAVVALAGAIALIAGGRIVGVWFGCTAVFAWWLAIEPSLATFAPARLARRITPDTRAIPVVVAVSFLSARFALHVDEVVTALVLQVAAVAVAVVARVCSPLMDHLTPKARHAVERVTRGIRVAVKNVLEVALVGLVWIITSLVPWAFDRIVRFDPLESTKRGRSTWVERRFEDDHPDRLWFDDPSRRKIPFGRRIRSSASLVLSLVVILGVGGYFIARPDPAQQPEMIEARVLLSQEEGSGAVSAAERTVYGNSHFSQFVGAELADHTSEYLNISDGRRRTWTGPCEGRSLIVWMFGGSTLFGVEQRDEATLPSEVAKAAARAGRSLTVRNFGVPGEVSWQSAHRLERELAGEEVPDIVVFYDGFNDVTKTYGMDFTNRGGPLDFVGGTDATAMRMLDDINGVDTRSWKLVRAPVNNPTLTLDEGKALAAKQYAVADRTARLLTEDRDIEFLHLFQPGPATRDRPVKGELESLDPRTVEATESLRSRLPAEVVDITDALDEYREPLYFDEIHTIAKANQYLAPRVLEEMQPMIRAADEAGGGVPCE